MEVFATLNDLNILDSLYEKFKNGEKQFSILEINIAFPYLCMNDKYNDIVKYLTKNYHCISPFTYSTGLENAIMNGAVYNAMDLLEFYNNMGDSYSLSPIFIKACIHGKKVIASHIYDNLKSIDYASPQKFITELLQYSFFLTCDNLNDSNYEMLPWLYSLGSIDIRYNNDYAYKHLLNKFMNHNITYEVFEKLLIWFCSICPNYQFESNEEYIYFCIKEFNDTNDNNEMIDGNNTNNKKRVLYEDNVFTVKKQRIEQ